MSKIGKINISIPDKVKVSLEGQNLKMEGPMGKNNLPLDMSMFELNISEGKEVSIKPKIVNPNTKRIWGLNRSLINNAIIGISKGYSKTLELSGVGFRAALKGNLLKETKFAQVVPIVKVKNKTQTNRTKELKIYSNKKVSFSI